MHDQANALRGLMEHRSKTASQIGAGSAGHSHVLTVTSGKGGVGKSNVALNLAISLAQAKQSVLLMDVNWGIGNSELLCGLNSQWNVSHVLEGAKRLEEILIEGPNGMTMLPGAGSLAERRENPEAVEIFFQQLAELKRRFRFVIVDLGTGIHRELGWFLANSDRVQIVTSAEPTSLAEAYATIKSLANGNSGDWEILVNQAASANQAENVYQRLQQTTRVFLKRELAWGGWVPQDSHVANAVAIRRPYVLEFPHCPATAAIKQMARRLINQTQEPKNQSSDFQETRSYSAAREARIPLAVP